MNQLRVESEHEQKIAERSIDLITSAGRCKIENDEHLEMASELCKYIKGVFNKAEAERKELTTPLNGVIKNINARFKKITDPLKQAEVDVKSKMLAYTQEKRRAEELAALEAAREAEEAALQAAEMANDLAESGNNEAAAKALIESESLAEAAEQAIEQQIQKSQAATAVRGFTSTSSVKKTWTFDLTDIVELAKQHPELVQVNAVEINKLIRAGERKIAGLNIYQKETIQVR